MTGIASKAFQSLADDLEATIRRTVDQFLVRRGYTTIEIAPMDQMSPSLNETARQILMFGADLWPAQTPRIKLISALEKTG